MKRHPAPAGLLHEQRGFTLVELMIAVVVVALLAAVALPSFMDSIRKSRRAEAFAALAQVQQAQERWRGNNPGYTLAMANTADAGSPANGLGVSTETASGYYEVSIHAPPDPWTLATGYEARAVAVAGSQLADGNCKTLAVRMQDGNLTYGSGTNAEAMSWTDANRCWAR